MAVAQGLCSQRTYREGLDLQTLQQPQHSVCWVCGSIHRLAALRAVGQAGSPVLVEAFFTDTVATGQIPGLSLLRVVLAQADGAGRISHGHHWPAKD
jgi:hypothetical protein